MPEATETKKMTSKTERRKYPRHKKRADILAGEVTYPVNEDNFARGFSENISLGGIMMNTKNQFEKGSLIQLRITLPGWHKCHPGFIRVLEDSIASPLTAICEVLRCEQAEPGYATAARFINIDPDDFVGFQSYLDKQTRK
jgi:hypothetical protein